MSEVAVRNDITDKMTRRAKYRRNRRNRKTRYRKARWLNRANSIKNDRYSPTMQSKLHSHVKEIEYIKSILPITKMVFETGQFDTHLMKNPSLANPKVKRWGYQKGIFIYSALLRDAEANGKQIKTIQFFDGVTLNFECVLTTPIFKSNH